MAKKKSSTRGTRAPSGTGKPSRKTKLRASSSVAPTALSHKWGVAGRSGPSAHARFASVVNARARLDSTIAVERADRMALYARSLAAFKSDPRVDGALVLRILAEGDSWFDYPVPFKTDTIRALQRRISTPIANMAHFGEEVRQMLGLKLRMEIASRFSQGAPDGHPWDAMLFSGGGNDFVGDPLCLWLRTYIEGMTADEIINELRLDAVLDIVKAGYVDLIALRDRLSPKTVLFFHQYDFAVPNGKGVCGFGPWLEPALKYKGVPEAIRTEVIRVMLKKFAAVLATVASATPNSPVIVPTQGTFPNQSSKWWANELHPTDEGFRAIADKIYADLKKTFPGLR